MVEAIGQRRTSRLLIVEDDDAYRQVLTDIMRDDGFEVLCCGTAVEALLHVEKGGFGVAIVDLSLPDLPGTELLEKIRVMSDQVRVIIHTGYGSFDSAKTAVNLGAFAYLEKLSDPAELIGHVHRAFQERLRSYADHLEEAVAQRTRELSDTNATLQGEIAERERVEEELRFRNVAFQQLHDIAVAPTSGIVQFCDSVVAAMAHVLNVSHAAIEWTNRSHIELISMFAQGELVHGGRFALVGTPCENVHRDRKMCIFYGSLRDLFPDDEFFQNHPMKVYVGAPLLGSDGEVFGIINMMDVRERAFSEEDREIVEIFGQFAASFIQRKRAEETLGDKTEYIRLLQAVAVDANQSSSVEWVMRRTLALICGHTGWPIGHAYLLAEDRDDLLVPSGIWHEQHPERFASFREITAQTCFERGVGLPGRVLAAGEPAWIADVNADAGYLRAAQCEDAGLKTGFAFPVLCGARVEGVLEFYSSEAAQPDASLLEVMAQIGTQLGRVMERSRAEQALREAHDQLETRVEARTAELAAKNTRLRGEIAERERAEEALRRSELHLNEAQAMAKVGHWRLNAGTSEITGSDELFRVFGLSRAEATLQEFAAVVHPEDRDYDLSYIQRGIDHGESWDIEHRLVCKDGTEKTVHTIGTAIVDETGKTVQLVGTVQDITEHRQAEDALRKAEQRYRTLFEESPDAIVIIDSATLLPIEFNSLAPDLLGYSREEFAGLRISDYEAVETAEETKAHVEKVLRMGRDKFETRMRTKHGDIKDIVVSVRVLEMSGRRVLHSIFRDVTARKRAEDENRRLGAALESAGEAIVITDPEGIIQHVNPAFVQLTGYSPREAIGQTPRILKSGTHPDDFYRSMWDAIKIKQAWTGETVNRRKDGSLFDVHLTIAPVLDVDGCVEGFVAVQRDITERKRAEELARQHHAELAHASRLSAMGEMASGLAHELNQPYGAICAYADACKMMVRSGDLDELVDTVDKIAVQADRAGQIIHRVQRFVRKQAPQRSTVDVNEVVREVVGLIEQEARLKGVKISLELSDLVGPVFADTIHIQQVVLNLARNAFDAMKSIEDGERELTISSEVTQDDTVTIAVRDNGIGLDAGAEERMFDPFFTTKPEGMGMGLSVSQSIVRAHGGRLYAKGNSGRGVTFHVVLPCGNRDRDVKS